MRDKQARKGRLRKIRVHLPLRCYLTALRRVLRRALGRCFAGLQDGVGGEESGVVNEQPAAPKVREGKPNQEVPFPKNGHQTLLT